MRRFSTEAVVLRTGPLGDSDRVVVLYTADHGKIAAAARAAASSRKRFGGGLEPMSRIRAELTEVAGRELLRLDSLDILESSFPVLCDPERLTAFSYIAELTDALTEPHEASAPLFRLLGHVMKHAKDRPLRLVVRYFEVWILRLEGVLPGLDRCQNCGRALRGHGLKISRSGDTVLCYRCPLGAGETGVGASAETLQAIRILLDKPLDGVVDYGIFERNSGQIEAALRCLVEAHASRPLRSAKFLNDMP